jgi:hypothetical protein
MAPGPRLAAVPFDTRRCSAECGAWRPGPHLPGRDSPELPNDPQKRPCKLQNHPLPGREAGRPDSGLGPQPDTQARARPGEMGFKTYDAQTIP